MQTIKTICVLFACCFAWQFLLFQSHAFAEGSFEESIDCTDVRVNYIDDPNLTREERLRRMDQAFFESLNRFELCQAAKEKEKAATADNGSGGSQGSQGSQNGHGDTGGNPSGRESVASSAISGTEEPKEFSPAESSETKAEQAPQDSQNMAKEGSRPGEELKQANGRTPEDIPSAKNDDVLAAQIRYAAETEPDPEKSRKLWNEYRKYKGLPVK